MMSSISNHYWPYLLDDTNAGNLKESTSLIKCQNMTHMRENYIIGIVRAQENESIELFIDEIIRLSKPIK